MRVSKTTWEVFSSDDDIDDDGDDGMDVKKLKNLNVVWQRKKGIRQLTNEQDEQQ